LYFELKILGSNSATPVFNRHQTAQTLQIENEFFLIDCGEGTQMQLSKYKVKISKINYIFISHLHGDHYLGLVGLISTMHLFGRTKDLHIFGPPGLAEIITVQFKYSETVLNFHVIFKVLETEKNEIILRLPNVTIETIPLFHRIACCGFLFKETPKKRRIKKELMPEGISLQAIAQLKKGEDILDANGAIKYSVEELTWPRRKSCSYAYMSDTSYNESYLELIKDTDLLYHEATFLHELEKRAEDTHHTTALQAAQFASKAAVKKLVIGHFSSRYKDLTPLLQEAKRYFKNTYLAIEGESFSISDE